MTNKSDLADEAKRCAEIASKNISAQHRRLFDGLAHFYQALAETEPEITVIPSIPPCSFDPDGGVIRADKEKVLTRSRSDGEGRK